MAGTASLFMSLNNSNNDTKINSRFDISKYITLKPPIGNISAIGNNGI